MAAKKKAKAKSKTKRRKTTAKRPAVRKKPVKVVKKQVAKKPSRTKVSKKTAPPPSPPPPPPPPGERIGVVTHYFGHLSVAVIKLESATLRVGDAIHIRGHTTDFSQRVESLQVGHAPVNEVGPNDDFGLKVIDHAREHDVVYKVK